jgi:hypothetical protein
VTEPLDGPEPQVGDVAAALLNLASSDRRLAMGPLIAMIESVLADGQLHRADRGMIFDLASAPRRRTGRVTR